MFLIGAVLVFAALAGMDCDPLIMVVYLHTGRGVQQLYFLAYEAVRDAVVMLVCAQAYMAVFHHGSHSLLLKLEAVHGKGPQRASLDLLELLAAAV